MRMELQTKVEIRRSAWTIEPRHRLFFVGSCFAENIGRRFADSQFRVVVNPFGVMYNPASIFHTVQRYEGDVPDVAVLTLGTNHVYVLKETGEIVDNCQKRPQILFDEQELSVEQCAGYLKQAIQMLVEQNPDVHVILTVSPIRYRKYGYHGSQLSKSTLLLAAHQLVQAMPERVTYFDAYELMNDELRDYRFYREDMLHPSEQAVSYIWQRFGETFFSKATIDFIEEWRPIGQALAHRPFHADTSEYQAFLEKAQERAKAFRKKYGLQEIL
uniref:GSCFA domain-containing protein n=1 Tax=Prevotella sp. GTC17260 TaxID=3236796 RepID=A0AB33JIC9_9BACT